MTAPPRRPQPGRVDLWLLDGPVGPAGIDCVRLDPSEDARATRMATDDLQRQVRRRRRFLRAVLAGYLDLPPERVPLAAAEGGKPVLAPGAGLHFNLSHTGDLSVLAVGADPLGVDVERPKPFDRLGELMAYACSPRERQAIVAAPDAEAAFLDRWVLKEAILKCRGSGLVDNLRAIDPGPVSQAPTRWKELVLQALRPPHGPTGLHLALAVSGPLNGITWHRPGIDRPHEGRLPGH